MKSIFYIVVMVIIVTSMIYITQRMLIEPFVSSYHNFNLSKVPIYSYQPDPTYIKWKYSTNPIPSSPASTPNRICDDYQHFTIPDSIHKSVYYHNAREFCNRFPTDSRCPNHWISVTNRNQAIDLTDK